MTDSMQSFLDRCCKCRHLAIDQATMHGYCLKITTNGRPIKPWNISRNGSICQLFQKRPWYNPFPRSIEPEKL
jgi:hypothetical protein